VDVTVVEPHRGGEARLVRDELLEEERWFSEAETDTLVADRADAADRAGSADRADRVTGLRWCPA